MFQQQLAGFGGCGSASVTYQQVLAQLNFQQTHLTAQGRLGNAQDLRCPGKAAQFGHAHKVFELFEVHICPFRSYRKIGYSILF